MHAPPLNSIAFIGSYVPRRCGIATYTADLRTAVAAHLPDASCLVLPLNDGHAHYDYPTEVAFEIRAEDPSAYERAAAFLNLRNADVVSLQHEYGIFGGDAGAHVLGLLHNVRAPVHTTLHTVLARPSLAQRRVMTDIIHLSARLAVMTERGRTLLHDVHGVPPDRIDVIPHGIPDMPLSDPGSRPAQLGLQGGRVLLTFGLLSPAKGIEHAIEALPTILARHPDVVYVVLGATHPHLVAHEGERYRDSLQRRAADLGIEEHVMFHDRYVDLPDLVAFLAAADVYLTPYLNEDQITSGTLAYAFGCGTPVVSTPYWHAEELLADGRGVLVPFASSAAIAAAVCDLLDDHARRHAIRERARLLGRDMVWSRVAERYAAAFRHTRGSMTVKPRRASAQPPARRPRHELPPVRLNHVLRLTDSTGLLQHATFDIPNAADGYCTDDNARALTIMVRLDDLGLGSPASVRAATTYATFVGHAFVPASGRFRNFLSFDRRWLDDGGTDDCLGRALVALGTCIGRARRGSTQAWAMRLFAPALDAILDTTSPRAWALGIIAIQDYLRRLDGDRRVASARARLTARLVDQQRAASTDDWPWPEEIVAYDNARLCHALISSGRWTGDNAALETGLAMLDWLVRIQRAPSGRFAPVGSRGFLRRGEPAAAFDQQPLEAHATIDACLEAFHATADAAWADRAWDAFDWFLGHNVVGLALCDPATGGCRDGLLEDRTNDNQGAESTLAWLGSLVEMIAFTTLATPRHEHHPHRSAPAAEQRPRALSALRTAASTAGDEDHRPDHGALG
ncbi:MAG: glycosyltransferase family 4 protein [Planctomycetia bacterium]